MQSRKPARSACAKSSIPLRAVHQDRVRAAGEGAVAAAGGDPRDELPVRGLIRRFGPRQPRRQLRATEIDQRRRGSGVLRTDQFEGQSILDHDPFLHALRGRDKPASICYNMCMTSLKVTRVGNSVGVILPREVLAQLKVELGDSLFLTETPDGFRLTPYDPEFEEQIAVAKRVMKRDRAILHELAK